MPFALSIEKEAVEQKDYLDTQDLVEIEIDPESASDVHMDGGLWKWQCLLEPRITSGNLRRQCFNRRLPRAPSRTPIPDWRRTL